MLENVLEIMVFSTIGTILLLFPILPIPMAIILIRKYKRKEQKGA